MQAFVIDRYKGGLAQREMPDPSPRPGDVVVAIQATSLNPLDAKIRDGELKFILPYRLPVMPARRSSCPRSTKKEVISMSKTNPGVALVTGTSSGIGRATAKALQNADFREFGTSRRAASERSD